MDFVHKNCMFIVAYVDPKEAVAPTPAMTLKTNAKHRIYDVYFNDQCVIMKQLKSNAQLLHQ